MNCLWTEASFGTCLAGLRIPHSSQVVPEACRAAVASRGSRIELIGGSWTGFTTCRPCGVEESWETLFAEPTLGCSALKASVHVTLLRVPVAMADVLGWKLAFEAFRERQMDFRIPFQMNCDR